LFYFKINTDLEEEQSQLLSSHCNADLRKRRTQQSMDEGLTTIFRVSSAIEKKMVIREFEDIKLERGNARQKLLVNS
jgi:hypothetical protein